MGSPGTQLSHARSQGHIALTLTLEILAWKTARNLVRGIPRRDDDAEGTLLLSADQTSLAERDLLALAKSIVTL